MWKIAVLPALVALLVNYYNVPSILSFMFCTLSYLSLKGSWSAINWQDSINRVPGQNGDKRKRRKSKRRHQNGDNPKRRQYMGNITKTATEKFGQNGDKEQSTAKCFKEGC